MSEVMNKRSQKAYDNLLIHAKNRGWQISDIFRGAKTKILMICPKGHHVMITPDSFKEGHGCRECAGTCPVAAERNHMKLAADLGYEVLGQYKGACTPISMRCPEGHVRSIRPNGFKAGSRCIECAESCPIGAEERYRKLAQDLNWTIKGEYMGTGHHLLMICPEGHQRMITPHRFKRGDRCAECNGLCPTASLRDLTQLAAELNWEILQPYTNANTPILMRCPEGHECRICPGNFKRGKGCAMCHKFHGETLVASALTHLGITFRSEYKIPSTMYRYDFAFNHPNTGHGVIIEFDGKQHFEFNDYFFESIQEFEYRRQIDILKTRTITDLGCKIIRIDHTWVDKSVQEVAKFIGNAIQSPCLFVTTNSAMYQWIYTSL